MTTNFKISDVKFGEIAAEDDSNLNDYFYAKGTAGQARTGAFLVLGRKGAGKTALLKNIEKTSQDEYSVATLNLGGFVFDTLRELKQAGVTDAVAFQEAWRATFLIKIADTLYREMSWKHFLHKRAIRKILMSLRRGDNSHAFADIFPSIAATADIPFLPIKLQVSRPNPERAGIARSTQNDLDRLEDTLKKLYLSYPFLTLVDQLDESWDSKDNPDRESLIIGAVRAAKKIRGSFSDITTNRSAPVIIFLRTDIWHHIQYNDKNKDAENAVLLEWTDSDLHEMIRLRARKTLHSDDLDFWATLVDKEKLVKGQEAQTYITKRVLGRPRDMIAFLKAAQKTAADNGHEVIEKQDIYDSEKVYSQNYIPQELRDELTPVTSNLDVVFETLRHLEYYKVKLGDIKNGLEARGIPRNTVDELISLLFNSSVFGKLVKGGVTGGSQWSYKYQDKRLLEPQDEDEVQVHPSLWKGLGLKERRH